MYCEVFEIAEKTHRPQKEGDRQVAAVVKIGMLGIIGVLLAIQFKTQKPEYGILTSIGICVVIFGFVMSQLQILMGKFEQLRNYLGNAEGYLTVLVRIIGITYICEFAAAICKDAGYAAVSEQIEILGKLSVIGAGLPILFAVIEQIQSFS